MKWITKAIHLHLEVMAFAFVKFNCFPCGFKSRADSIKSNYFAMQLA